jgi:hypothetical protein
MALPQTQLATLAHKPAGKGGLHLIRNLPWTELAVPLAVLAIILAMITPLPSRCSTY